MTTWVLIVTILCSGEPGCEPATDEYTTTEAICRIIEAHSDESLPWTILVECVEGEE